MPLQPLDNKKKTSSDAWLVVLLILFLVTIAVFLMVVLKSATNPVVVADVKPPSIDKPIEVPSPSPSPKPLDYLGEEGPRVLFHGDTPVGASDILRFSNLWVSRHLKSLPEEAPVRDTLAGIPIQSVKVGRSFYIYDVKLIPVDNTFQLVVLMELPRIDVFLSKPYSTYYPSINPYIHVVEFTFSMDVEDKIMFLTSISLFTVDWETNRYKTMYEQTINSPVCIPDMPKPVNLSKEELSRFLWAHKIFDAIQIETEKGLQARPAQQSSIASTPPPSIDK